MGQYEVLTSAIQCFLFLKKVNFRSEGIPHIYVESQIIITFGGLCVRYFQLQRGKTSMGSYMTVHFRSHKTWSHVISTYEN